MAPASPPANPGIDTPLAWRIRNGEHRKRPPSHIQPESILGGRLAAESQPAWFSRCHRPDRDSFSRLVIGRCVWIAVEAARSHVGSFARPFCVEEVPVSSTVVNRFQHSFNRKVVLFANLLRRFRLGTHRAPIKHFRAHVASLYPKLLVIGTRPRLQEVVLNLNRHGFQSTPCARTSQEQHKATSRRKPMHSTRGAKARF